jgi:hypothetical protein
MNIDDATQAYLRMRDRVKQIKEKHKQELAPFNEKMDKIESALLKYFSEKGMQSCRTKHGTPYITERMSVKVVDREAYLAYVLENNALPFLESKANTTAVKEYMEEHEDTPPGVKVTVERKVNVRS